MPQIEDLAMKLTENGASELPTNFDNKLHSEAVGLAMRQGFIVGAVVFVVLTAIQLFAYFVDAISNQSITQFLINLILVPNLTGGVWFWWKRKQLLRGLVEKEFDLMNMMRD